LNELLTINSQPCSFKLIWNFSFTIWQTINIKVLLEMVFL
jgi:hypothetical protein